MSSINKRKEAVTAEESPAKKKLSRQARYNKKRKLEKEQNSTFSVKPNIPIPSSINNIVFNPNRHRTQSATRGLSTYDKINYLENEWKSVPILPSDRVSTSKNKFRHEISTKILITETLIREAKTAKNDVYNSFEIPPEFSALVNRDIIDGASLELDKSLWISFGVWLGFQGKIKRREVRQHLRLGWQRLRHTLDSQSKNKFPATNMRSIESLTHITANFFNPASPRITEKEKIRMITSVRKWRSPTEITGFRCLINPGCVVDVNSQTLLHLGLIDNFDAVEKATDAVNHYYFHTLEHPSHRSESFWKNFIEHYGAFTLNNLFPYTSSNTASSHNSDHQKCVDKLLCDLRPLSDSINRFLKKYYGNLYEKLSNLKWGPFAPRPFGIFPMIAINYNTISDYHWDENDEANSFCCLVALGDFEGGELCFPQLKIIVPLRPRQVILFSSRLLLHGNFVVTKGIRHSVVYFVHSLFFHHQRDFSNIYNDLRDGIEKDARGSVVPMIPRQELDDARNLNNRIRLDKPKASQIRVPPSSTDCRRGHIDLSRARRGLKAEDPLPDPE